MSFPHRDREFPELLRIVAEKEGLSIGLVEKDYWVTHVLWAIHHSGLEVWFKGGTSLSKGFQLIQRFSEDLDVRIDAGTVTGLVEPENWSGRSRGQVRKQSAFYEDLADNLGIPDVEVRIGAIFERGRGAEYEIDYPGSHQKDVEAIGMRPFVLLEAGRARVTPFVERGLSSFVHDYLREQGEHDLLENVPASVRCVHPLVTLLDKLDAISRRYERGSEEEDFARHYEDGAQIVRHIEALPPLDMSPAELADEMLANRDIRKIPSQDDEAFSPEGERLAALETSCARMDGMFWGPRVAVGECCAEIKEWIRQQLSE